MSSTLVNDISGKALIVLKPNAHCNVPGCTRPRPSDSLECFNCYMDGWRTEEPETADSTISLDNSVYVPHDAAKFKVDGMPDFIDVPTEIHGKQVTIFELIEIAHQQHKEKP